MDKNAKGLGSVRKETKRRSRHNHNPTSSENPQDTNSFLEPERKPLKHQISYLLNQGQSGSSSSQLEGWQSESQTRRLEPQHPFGTDTWPSMRSGASSHLSTGPQTAHPWRDNILQSKAHRQGYHGFSRHSSAEKRRTCEQCGKVFAQPADLKKHVKCVHLKERPFQCEECDAAFGEKGNLNRHKKSVHNKERPWICEQCGLPFAFRDTLTRHVRAVHQDIRPFSCSHCQSAFKKRDHLHRHQEALHGIQKRPCKEFANELMKGQRVTRSINIWTN